MSFKGLEQPCVTGMSGTNQGTYFLPFCTMSLAGCHVLTHPKDQKTPPAPRRITILKNLTEQLRTCTTSICVFDLCFFLSASLLCWLTQDIPQQKPEGDGLVKYHFPNPLFNTWCGRPFANHKSTKTRSRPSPLSSHVSLVVHCVGLRVQCLWLSRASQEGASKPIVASSD